jgi:hypothetical protein
MIVNPTAVRTVCLYAGACVHVHAQGLCHDDMFSTAHKSGKYLLHVIASAKLPLRFNDLSTHVQALEFPFTYVSERGHVVYHIYW